ncbi:MAG: Uma2 family endonuclease [Isosphaeraceae bacterium]|nr:Uma2 family endonuclease [Isosphaeraceae bacterium]
MSTVEPPKRETLRPLVAGEHLDQPTFHERYEAMPPETRAELVGGIVYMPSPLRSDHGDVSLLISGWVFYYMAFTPGLKGGDNTTTKLGRFGEPQPDCILYIPEELGGENIRIVDGYVTGAPELVVEVARSSRKFDLTEKKRDYERAGVPEYVVVGVDPNDVYWFVLRDGHYVEHPPAPDGLFHSQSFPGLWLDPTALFDEDRPGLMAAVDRGVATAEHREFFARLNARRQGPQ